MSITGADGLPAVSNAGNVLRPSTTIRISMRQCPAADAGKMEEILREKLTKDVPYNMKIDIHGGHTGSGWCMKPLQPWLKTSIEGLSKDFYGAEVGLYGLGGAIPFLKELEIKYPESQIVAMGVLGPGANAHGPNENLNLPYTKKLLGVLAHLLVDCGK